MRLITPSQAREEKLYLCPSYYVDSRPVKITRDQRTHTMISITDLQAFLLQEGRCVFQEDEDGYFSVEDA